MLIDDARQILAVWRERLLSDEDVRAWSWRMIERTPADDLPDWLLDLAAQGPWKCLSRPSSEFIDVPFLEFVVGFSLRVQTTDFANPAEVDEFVLWTARACMGQDAKQPEVGFGYQLDHLWHDCDRQDWARELVRDELPNLRPQLAPVSNELVELVAAAKARSEPSVRSTGSSARDREY